MRGRRCHRPGRNLVDQLERAHISWKAYYQSLPSPCSAVVKAGAYAKKTDPFAYLDDVRASPARCHRVVPLDRLRPDLRHGRLPRFVVIVPDLRHDMHSGPVGEADDFLRRLDQELATSSSWRPGTVLVVTFDEGTTSRGPHGRGGGHVATVVTGPGVPARRDPTPYTHYALLRSIEQRFGLPPLGNAADPATRTIPASPDRGGPRERLATPGSGDGTGRAAGGRVLELATDHPRSAVHDRLAPRHRWQGHQPGDRGGRGEPLHRPDHRLAQAPFLNRLAAKGTLLTSYFAITHPSLPNYIAMVSGDTQGITSDCGGCNVDAPNLADQLETAGISWKAYMEDLPAPCSDAHTAGAYAKKHDPFMYFDSVRGDPAAAPRSCRSTASTPTWPPGNSPASCSSPRTWTTTCTGPVRAATTRP